MVQWQADLQSPLSGITVLYRPFSSVPDNLFTVNVGFSREVGKRSTSGY